MVFSSSLFLFMFMPIFLFFYFGIPNSKYRLTRKVKNFSLFVWSLIFYAWGEPIYIMLMLWSIFMNFMLAKFIDRSKENGKPTRFSKFWLVTTVVANLAILGFFKYGGFIVQNIAILMGTTAPEWNIPLPIGISFYTFQILSYVIDVYRGEVQVQHKFTYLGAYVTAFPQLVAGPIVRYETIEKELHFRQENLSDFSIGIRRFIVGLAKKILIANNAAYVADTILVHAPGEYGALGAWVGILCYSLQIYYDFSGYSDMAIGLGRMLGFRFLENFNYPYISRSVTDFWRRWHISLSTFFRDYVYIPLGGNRVGKVRFIFNILIVWSLTGLWHGAAWNFVLWGIYYGILLLGEKLIWGKLLARLPRILQHIYTIPIFIIGWAIFRMTNLEALGQLLDAMFGGYGPGSWDFLSGIYVLQGKYIIAFALGVIGSMPILPQISKLTKWPAIRFIADIVLIALFLFTVIYLISGGYNPFIYFRF